MTQTQVMFLLEVEEGKTLLCGPAADSYGNRVGSIVEGEWGGGGLQTYFLGCSPLFIDKQWWKKKSEMT